MLVDGMALLFRGFFATSYRGQFMLNKSGVPTNGIYGFLRYFINAFQTFQPTHVICCWDMGSKTFRTELFDAYKGNRDEPPTELIPQFDLIKSVVEALEVPNVGIKGYEADDCIGTLAKQLQVEADVIILTGDQDILQLVDERVSVAIMRKGHGNYAVYTPESFLEEKGIVPPQMIDLKGLMGDTSDNYPGVKGIGEKTALKLLQEHGSIDGILDNLDKLSKSIRSKIETDLDMLHLSRRLATIHCEAPITCSLEEALWTFDSSQALERLRAIDCDHMAKLVQVS
ncbi:5'-3' exonuclease [Pullulanibacillus sp. KACC 23026]|uniref:5'-3' exonuclease n=1 Tax=Pullulanibacillus sp. KACC 23026 TaxID=3028315 RepID=UPI0023AF3A29|nr:5'-3' exonuclease [Pullulanibacillus sp. KACC 23026]WEG14903.1 5'-3' exonuclease [Pullulanibacillus sp. KACC 23026]